MGTSLSGLTPATTFDGLLKTSDNEPLGATLKAISTGEGTDTMLELSTSALQIGGATGMYWDNTNKRLGIGTDAPSTPLQVNGSIRSSGSGTQIFEFSSASLAQFRAIFGSVGFRVGSGMFIGGADGGPASSTRLHIKGSGATSATTSLLVQNSANNIFSVRDDGALLFYRAINGAELLRIEDTGNSPRFVAGNNAGKSLTLGNDTITSAFSSIQFKTFDGSAYSEAMRITGNTNQFVGIGETTPTARLHVKGSGNTATTTALLVQNSDGTDILKVQDDGITTFGQNDQSGSIPTGVEFQPNSLNPTWGPSIKSYYNNNKWLQIEKGSRYYTFADSGLGINLNATPSAQLHVKSSGATSATTALLVQNSAGTELFRIKDNYTTQITTDGGSSPALYLNTGSGREGGDGGLSIGSDTTKFNINARFGNGVINASSSLFLTSSVGIGGNYTSASGGSDASAILAVSSTTQGFLPPRMADSERDAITSPATGLMIYDTTNNQMNYFNGSNWVAF